VVYAENMTLIRFRISSLILFFHFISQLLYAQVPTKQDCLGAMPICQNVYSVPTTSTGSGNYQNEIQAGGGTCLAPPGQNEVWYVFTVQASGNLSFLITPNVSTADYDWQVFNITGKTCADIFTDPSLSVSCNSSGQRGNTGPNGGSGLSTQGPGIGTPFNAVIPVLAGETYVINIEDWYATSGYTINFSASTATIFDNVPPTLLSVDSVSCNAASLKFRFSERVLCNTVQDADFTLTGPGGQTLSGVTGQACAVGGTQEGVYTINISPAISTSGVYSLNLVGGSGFVTDLCGNVALPGSITFTLNCSPPGPCTGSTLAASSVSTQAICGNNNGSVNVTTTGGVPAYTYLWNNAQTNATATNLSPGTYTVIVTDANNCSITRTVSVTQPTALTASVTTRNASCLASNGMVMASASGGTAGYTYSWSNGQSAATITGLAAGNYSVIISDSNGCTLSQAAIVASGTSSVTATVTSTQASCTANNGTSTVTPGGGTSPYTYSWSNGQSAQTATGLSAGSYSVLITDANGCTFNQSAAVTSNNPVTVSVSSTQTGCSVNNGSATANQTGGTAPHTYSWSNGQAAQTATGLAAGTYSVTVTDANGCTKTQNVSVTQTPGPVANVIASPFTIARGSSMSFNATGGSTYVWSPPTGLSCITCANPIATPYVTTKYCVTVMDAGGCSDDTCITIQVILDCSSETLYLPNAFSPNDDGENDLLQAYIGTVECIQTFRLAIYNRWGENIFETTDPLTTWDGTHRGKKENTAVFVFYLEATLSSGEQISKKGSLWLLR